MTSVHVFVGNYKEYAHMPKSQCYFWIQSGSKNNVFFVIFELYREHAQIGEELRFVLSLIELYLDKVLRICKRMAKKFIHKNID